MDYLPRNHEGDVRSIKVNWKDPSNAVSDAEQYLERGLSVMFLASCSYMLQPLIRILRETGTPFHNPYRRRNGAWNPLQRGWGQTTTGDRILAFLQMTQGGLWTAEDVNRWTEMVKVKGALNDKGRKIVKQLVDGEEGMLEWDDIHAVFTEEAVEAGLTGDLDWFEQQLTSAKKTAAIFPLAIIKNRGPKCLNETHHGPRRVELAALLAGIIGKLVDQVLVGVPQDGIPRPPLHHHAPWWPPPSPLPLPTATAIPTTIADAHRQVRPLKTTE